MHLHIYFNSDILSLFTKELKGKILDSALALRGKNDSIVWGKK